MKKLLFLVFLITFIACKDEAKQDYAIISGNISNLNNTEVTINSNDRTFTKTLSISSEGKFSDTLSTDINTYVLYDGKNPIFLNIESGYNLTINYDAYNFDNTLSITGNGSEVNEYIVAKRKNEKVLFGESEETYSLEEVAFKEKLRSIKKSQVSLLSNFKGISIEFINNEKRNLNYIYLDYLNNYQNAHRYYTKKDDFKVSGEFLKEFDGLDYSNESDFNFSSAYKSIVTEYYKNEANKLSQTDSLNNDLAYLKTAGFISIETIKNGLLFDFANYNMTYSKDVDVFYNTYLSASTNEKNNATIKEIYIKLTSLVKGKPSPKFNNYENYDGGTTSLDDLIGNYVYVDVWATWCGPCIREIPFLKEVEKQYHDKNIKFVSISIDKAQDHAKWKTMVNDKDLGGLQLFADKDWNSPFVKDYQIQGIPRFILIDKEGNIVSSNAPRPSDPELIELLKELNI